MTEISTRQRQKINFNALAKDLALFGAEDLAGVLAVHGLDEIDLADLLETNAALRNKVKQLKKQIEADPTAILRMKAGSLVEANLTELSFMVKDTEAENKDRLGAMRLLSELADALPKSSSSNATAQAGVVLHLNLGSIQSARGRTDLPKPVNVIDMKP